MNRLVRWIAVLGLAATVAACSSKNKSSFLLQPAEDTSPTVRGNVTTAAVFDFMKLLPDLLPSAYAEPPPMPANCAATYGYMCLGWEFFTLLREFDPATNDTLPGEDVVGSENLYFELNLAGLEYESLEADAEALPAPVAIPPPFDFGATTIRGETYDHAKNGISDVGGFGYSKGDANIALRDDGTTRHFLIAVGSNENSGWTASHHKLVMQGTYDETGGDLELNFVQFVQYPDGPMAGQDIVQRSYIKGNARTHYFVFQASTINTGSGPGYWNWGNMQGAGYSQGAGQHFLVFYRGTNAAFDPNGVPGPGTTGAYYCMQADTTKALFGAGIYTRPAGYRSDEVPADCADYIPVVDGQRKWEITNTQSSSPSIPIVPTTNDYPVSGDSPLFTGAGPLSLRLAL